MTSETESTPNFQEGSKPALFLELATPDALGFSRVVSVEEFTGRYESLKFGNGGDWIRRDGSLAKSFNIRRHPAGRGKITGVELQGYRKVVIQKPIPAWIRDEVTKEKCIVLATGNPQCDHKDGRLDDPRLSDTERLTLDDFQPMSSGANNAKRQHCAECRETGNRFNATRLGYRVSEVRGDGIYNGTCVGCYWHDPIFFNSEVSKNFSTGDP